MEVHEDGDAYTLGCECNTDMEGWVIVCEIPLPDGLTTKGLVEELVKRQGVKEVGVEPHTPFYINVGPSCLHQNTGPARILVVID